MNKFTAAEYRLAAKIAMASDLRDVAGAWTDAADKAQALEHYATKLGVMVHHSAPPFANGMKLLTQILDDGWTPPEGLI